MKNAIEFIEDANLDANNITPVTIHKLTDKAAFIDFFANNVILIRVEIPGDTDVASYFEIMNNRGVQLQKHEILKSLLMAKIDNQADQKEFAYIWDACSQMDSPIQRNFNTELRRKYFGEKYDDFIFPFKDSPEDNIPINQLKPFSISDILQGKADNGLTDNKNVDDEEIEEEASEYKSIIDFPNFLMHILKLRYKTNTNEIQLNEK